MFGSIKDFIRGIRIQILRGCLRKPLVLQSIQHILLVAPHPDDEVIGCAGLIQQLLKAGKQIDVVILSGGEKSHSGCCHIDEIALVKARRELSRQAAQIVGLPLEHLHFLNYPDGGIAYNHHETNRLKQLITDMKPDAIFIPHKGEGWSDHVEAGRIIKELTEECTDIQLYEYCVWFWYYNVWDIDWEDARFVKMGEKELRCKLKAMDAYITPLAPCGKPWSGVLPKVFLKANQWNKELYFRVRK